MEILRLATEWAKDEVFSSKIFMLSGIVFIISSVGFWQIGKTELARAYIYPTLIAGGLLIVMGLSFYLNNKSKLTNFEIEYKTNPSEFIKSEIIRTEKTIGEYENIAFKVFPVIIIVCALSIIFTDQPYWRAISITVIAFTVVVLLIDSNANTRIKAYNKELKILESK